MQSNAIAVVTGMVTAVDSNFCLLLLLLSHLSKHERLDETGREGVTSKLLERECLSRDW